MFMPYSRMRLDFILLQDVIQLPRIRTLHSDERSEALRFLRVRVAI